LEAQLRQNAVRPYPLLGYQFLPKPEQHDVAVLAFQTEKGSFAFTLSRQYLKELAEALNEHAGSMTRRTYRRRRSKAK
jgi:hypothetical protein